MKITLRLTSVFLAFMLFSCLSGVVAQDDDSANSSIAGKSLTLKNCGMAGLDKRVELRSVDPWDVVQLIEFLAHRGGINNIVIGKGVSGKTTKLKFENVTVGEALEVVLSVNKLAYIIKDNIITIITDEEYSKMYGVSFYDNKQVKIVDLKYADAGRIANMLQPVKSIIGTVVADPVTGTLIIIDTPEKIEQMLDVINKTDIPTISRIVPTETRFYKLQYADTDTVSAEITPLLTKDVGSMHADARTRTIIVTDLPNVLDKVSEIVNAFDEKEKQVFIEAKIVQVGLSDEFKLGVNWDYVIQGLDPRFKVNASVKSAVKSVNGSFSPTESQASGLSTPGVLSYQTIVGGAALNMVVAALKNMGDVKILSNPHVAVVSDEEATVKVVEDQPYSEAALESGTTNVVGETYVFIEVGVKLSVTPHINDNGMIRMDIKPEVSSVVGNYQGAIKTDGVPIVRKSTSETTVLIKDGETIIIAGMIENVSEKQDSGVPLLGRIPLFGWLFKTHSTKKETKETIVFLTPRIISGEEPVMLLRDMKKEPKPLRGTGFGDSKKMKPIR